MEAYTEVLAHYDKDEPHKAQGLLEHLINVAEKSKELGSRIGLGKISELIALVHDFGKVSKNFQLYIRGQYNGRVNHSSAGAILLENIEENVFNNYPISDLLVENKLDEKSWKLYKEILQYPVLAHHGFYDIINRNFNYKTGERLTRDSNRDKDEEKREEDFLNLINKKYKNIYKLYYESFKEFIPIYIKIINMAVESSETRDNQNVALNFYYGSLVRLLISILKEADIYDSSNYYRSQKDKIYSEKELAEIWLGLEKTINKQYEEFRRKENQSELDLIRTSLADDIYEFSKKYAKGSYIMNMPVGSGKTYAGLRYALGNASKFNKKRIFYTTAFLSVLEQNAATMKDLLGEKYILEHHSNIIKEYEGNEDENDRRDYGLGEYLVESWEAPIVLTSLVQLSNTFFKDRSSNIRRFSKLIDSVIIIDEIQSLPIKAIYNFNLMMNFLTSIMKVTVIHSTATPPCFHDKSVLKYPCNYGNGGEIFINKATKDEKIFDRVEYCSLLGEEFKTSLKTCQLLSHIKEEIKEENSALVVLNTKRAVRELYDSLREDQDLSKEKIEIIYLTTNQCPRHRLEIIKNMKKKLKGIRKGNYKDKIICISTKLVEAGVDIDFDIVYRSLAGIDNIIQIGGRCNREGEKLGKGKVYIFSYDKEKLDYLPEIKEEQYASRAALMASKRRNPNKKLDMEEVSKHYFNKLYLNQVENSRKLEYISKSKEYTILDLLSTNRRNYKNYRNKHSDKINFQLKQSFKTAAKEFNLIDDDSISVIVQYKNEEKINNLYEEIESKSYDQLKRTIKELQPYTIAIRNISEYEAYISSELEGRILILSKEAYDEKIGLNKGELESLVF